MKLSIKNARRLETQIDSEVMRLRSKLTSTSGAFKSVDESTNYTESSVNSYLVKISTLNKIKFELRSNISKFNESEGINDITLQIALMKFDLEINEEVYNMSSPRLSRSYNGEPGEYSAGLSDEVKESFHVKTLALKRSIQRLSDQCQGVNSRGTIEFDSETESFLKTSGLID